ncbi:hypothetical protein GCM10022247_34800 [Allokutzneria multivorans]|uniref:Uncharacterized protein n=1 Tax=Allokutzneria multivorans TaxID=1142134 RepID=A0ABP7SCH3_9PSEU
MPILLSAADALLPHHEGTVLFKGLHDAFTRSRPAPGQEPVADGTWHSDGRASVAAPGQQDRAFARLTAALLTGYGAFNATYSAIGRAATRRSRTRHERPHSARAL